MREIVKHFILTLTTVTQGAFYLSTEESNWFNASSLCKLGTPNFVRTDNGQHAEVPGLDLLNNEKIWTGYYRTSMILEYLDCVGVDDVLRMNGRLVTVDNDNILAKCISECRHTRLCGVTKSKCFCIEEKVFKETKRSKETKCIDECQYPRGVACGFESANKTYLSVYRANNNVSVSDFHEEAALKDEEKHCLEFNEQTRTFIWEGCKQKRNLTCYSDFQAHRIDGLRTWMEAANHCFSNKLVPSSISNAKTVIKNTRYILWTGVIRINIVDVIDNYYKDDKYGEKAFGVLAKMSSNDKYLLTFENGPVQRRSLCERCSQGTKTFSTVIIILSVSGVILCIVVIAFCVICQMRLTKKRTLKKMATHDQQAECTQSTESSDDQPCGIYVILEPHERVKEGFSKASNGPTSINTDVSQVHGSDDQYEIIDDHNSGKRWPNVFNRIDVDKSKRGKYIGNSYDKVGTDRIGQYDIGRVEYNRIGVGNENRSIHAHNVYDNSGEHRLKEGEEKQSDVVYNKLFVGNDKGKQHTDHTYNSFDTHGQWKIGQTNCEYNKLDDRNKCKKKTVDVSEVSSDYNKLSFRSK